MKHLFVIICLTMMSLVSTAQVISNYSLSASDYESIKEIKKSAKKGDAASQFKLGLYYFQEGNAIQGRNDVSKLVSYSKALEQFKKAAGQGHADAQFCIGWLHEHRYLDLDREGAWTYYEQSAKNGNVESIEKLFNYGRPEFLAVCSEQAEQNNVKCQMILAQYYEQKKDTTMAMQWYKKAAEKGNANSQYKLGAYYLTKRNISEAKAWLSKAADQNHSNAKRIYDDIVQREAEEAAQRELASKLKSYRIETQKPNTLLSHIQPSELAFIDSLTIRGFLYDTELKIITKQCKNLRYLNIENALTTKSPETLRDEEADRKAWASLVASMGITADNNYRDFRTSSNDYLIQKMFLALCSESAKVRKAEDICVIADYMLCDMPELETVILPKSLSSIGKMVFHNCPKLRNAILPPYLKEIKDGAFARCQSLQKINFPSTLASIGTYDRRETYGVNGEASFTNTRISVFDFSKCNFKNNGLSFWGYNFVGCNNLRELRIPNGVSEVTLRNLGNCTVYVPSTITYLDARGGKVFHFYSKTAPKGESIRSCTIYVPKGCTTSYFAKYGETNKYIEE